MTKDGWFLGFFDGEGCVMIVRRRRKGSFPWHYSPRITVTNTCKEAPELFLQEYGGRIGILHRRENYRTRYTWMLSRRNDVERVLRTWLPYLVVKKRPAEVALELIEYKKTHPRASALGASRGNPYSEEARGKFEELYQEIHSLNGGRS